MELAAEQSHKGRVRLESVGLLSSYILVHFSQFESCNISNDNEKHALLTQNECERKYTKNMMDPFLKQSTDLQLTPVFYFENV